MATKDNIVSNLPFDEPDGSTTAYDYSVSRADGVVSGANFVGGKSGNAIQFNGSDTCKISKSVLNLNSDFSIFAWVKGLSLEAGSPKKLIWLLNFNKGESFVEIPIELTPDLWINTALTRKGNTYQVYVNTGLVQTISNTGTLAGVSLLQDYYGGQYGKGCVDDFKIYNVALTQGEIVESMENIKQLVYSIDGINFKDYDVFVSDSDGLLDRPKAKKPFSVAWDNYHGDAVDLRKKYLESRDITLSCFIKANGKNDFATKVVNFLQLFDKPGALRLMVDIHPTKPLVYQVYCEDSVNIKKTWNDELMVGTFNIKLKEPEPVKKVLKHMRIGTSTKTCSIKLTTDKLVNIFWGDGSQTVDVYGDNVTITHDYEENGEYFVVITGCIDEIKSLTTNAIIVWNKL